MTTQPEPHALCGHVHHTDTARWFCVTARSFYSVDRKPRRSHDEVVADKDAHARAVVARREFNARKRAEREERRAKKLFPRA